MCDADIHLTVLMHGASVLFAALQQLFCAVVSNGAGIFRCCWVIVGLGMDVKCVLLRRLPLGRVLRCMHGPVATLCVGRFKSRVQTNFGDAVLCWVLVTFAVDWSLITSYSCFG